MENLSISTGLIITLLFVALHCITSHPSLPTLGTARHQDERTDHWNESSEPRDPPFEISQLMDRTTSSTTTGTDPASVPTGEEA